MRFPNESAAYRAARNQLLEQEIAQRRAMEAVAAARRALPDGGLVPEDYVFVGQRDDGSTGPLRLSELFAPDKDSLVIYHFMYGPTMEKPCPGCSSFLDSLDGAALHVRQRINFRVVASSPLPRILAVAEQRGWRNLRFISAEGTAFNRDYFGEDADGGQDPMMNVFVRRPDGIHHFWGSELLAAPMDPGQDMRHIGTLDLLWNVFDLTPEGRPADWHPRLSY